MPLIRRPWSRQPPSGQLRINPKHWLAPDLIFAHSGRQAFIYGAPVPALMNDAIRNNGMGGTGWRAIESATGWTPDGTNYSYWDLPASVSMPLSISGWWFGTASTTTDAVVVVRRPGNSNGGYALVRSTTELARVAVVSTAGGTGGANSTATFVSNQWMHGVAVFNSTTDRIIYGDGGNSASNTNLLDAGTDVSRVGIAVGVTNTPTAATTALGGIALPLVIGRALSADEVARLYREQRDNPWQLFEPRRIWVPMSAGGGTTVSVPAGTITYTGIAPTVSTPRTVSVPAGTITYTGLAPTVSAPRTVSVPAGTVTYTGFAPTVSTSTAISVPPGTITYTGFAPTVSSGSSAIITIPSGAFTLKGYAPTVSTSNPVSLGSKLDEFPSLPSDSAGLNRKLVDLFRYTNSRVNGLSEGRIFDHYNARTSQPASTEGAQGDFITNARPEELGSASSKYVVIGWIRLASDWVQCRVLTGN